MADTPSASVRLSPKTRFGRLLRFCLDQISGIRISFGSERHEQKLTLTFSFLSSLVASVVLVLTLWACGGAVSASGSHFTWSWDQMGFFPQPNLFTFLVRVIVATSVTTAAVLADIVEALGTVLLLFLAAASAGAIVGFLFGIPRPLSEAGPGAASAALAAASRRTPQAGEDGAAASMSTGLSTASATIPPAPGWYSNTNLTQISDWVTKIIVGLGLVEAHDIAITSRNLIGIVSPALFGGCYGAPLVITAVIVIGLIIGFLYCYLFTQLFLAAMMVQAADEVSGAGNLPATKPLAYAELAKISPASPVVAPAIRDPRSAAPIRKVENATPEQTIAAAQVQSVPLDAVDDPASLTAWARAGAVLDQYARAASGYAKLLTKIRTPDILAEAARVFASAEDFDGARELIKEAARQIGAADPAARPRIIFDAAHLALYDPAPQGYRRALTLLDDATLSQDDGGGLHVLHACALGQKYSHDTTLTGEDRTRISDQIQSDLRIALENSDNRPWILYLLGRNPDGTRRTEETGSIKDDDLYPFKDDPAFLALVGLKP